MPHTHTSFYAIGEKLETADKQRARAVLSKQLMEYFMQFNEGQCPTLESLMTQQGLEGQIEVRRRRDGVKLGQYLAVGQDQLTLLALFF